MDIQVAVIVWVVCGIAALLIAQSKGATNPVTWFFVGLLLGPLGLLIAALGANGPGKAPTPAIGAADELQKLAALRDNGTITAAEFERQKAGLLTQQPYQANPKSQAQRTVFAVIVIVLVAVLLWLLVNM